MNKPIVRVRFNNPQYNPATKKYKLDAEFQCDTPGQSLFGMNVRFHYDATKLMAGSNTNGKVLLTDFAAGYGMQNKAGCQTSTAGIALFGLPTKAMTFVNWAIQLNNPAAAPVIIPTDSWVQLFSIETETPTALASGEEFNPVFVWDTQDIGEVGYVVGNVITLVNVRGATSGSTTSKPTTEYATHWNWVDFPGVNARPFGRPTYLVV